MATSCVVKNKDSIQMIKKKYYLDYLDREKIEYFSY